MMHRKNFDVEKVSSGRAMLRDDPWKWTFTSRIKNRNRDRTRLDLKVAWAPAHDSRLTANEVRDRATKPITSVDPSSPHPSPAPADEPAAGCASITRSSHTQSPRTPRERPQRTRHDFRLADEHLPRNVLCDHARCAACRTVSDHRMIFPVRPPARVPRT